MTMPSRLVTVKFERLWPCCRRWRHVDQDAWRYLLRVHCGVFLGTEGEEVYEEEIPAKFLLFLIEDNEEDGQEYVKTLKNDIVQFCGVHQREHPSRAYTRALKRIAALDEKLKPNKPGIDIEIQVQVGFRVMDFMSYGVLSEILKPLQDIREAEKAVREEWEDYQQNMKKKQLEAGSLRCTFVLGPMIADFHDTKISHHVARLMETMVRENARFSQVNLWTFVGRLLEKKEHEKRVVFSQLMASIFDHVRRDPVVANSNHDFATKEQNDKLAPLQLGTVHLECTSLMGHRQLESLCSGIVTSQTTKKLSMQLEMDPDEQSLQWWKWLAYALFFKRARTCSSVECLALISIRSMTIEDIEAFSSVLASDHPEEELFGCPRGSVEERHATSKAGTSFFWEMNNRGQPRRGSHALTCELPMPSLKTFSDDNSFASALMLSHSNESFGTG
ncbi:unnamed protein product [Phytophthora lilii]|uniref:Unnamed protein product n=1 Tax=Phytophthora lilii TaxID=2077276 RepID=A0A9W6UAZ8_9STRA|nr:unnamed protein product [Phytophthora lilii]